MSAEAIERNKKPRQKRKKRPAAIVKKHFLITTPYGDASLSVSGPVRSMNSSRNPTNKYRNGVQSKERSLAGSSLSFGGMELGMQTTSTFLSRKRTSKRNKKGKKKRGGAKPPMPAQVLRENFFGESEEGVRDQEAEEAHATKENLQRSAAASSEVVESSRVRFGNTEDRQSAIKAKN